MGSKQSKTAAELDLDKIEQLADEQDYAKKKKHLEPDLIGAKLAAKAGCAAVIGRDMIFHAGANEYTHHPAGYKIQPKNGMYFFAQSDKNQPKLPYETMEFSAPYNKKLHGEDVEIKLGDELPLDINQEPEPVDSTLEITEQMTEPIPA